MDGIKLGAIDFMPKPIKAKTKATLAQVEDKEVFLSASKVKVPPSEKLASTPNARIIAMAPTSAIIK